MDNTPALRVFQNQKPVGYVIINTDFNETIGYSGLRKPVMYDFYVMSIF